MPIRLTIDRPNLLVLGVGSGVVTLPDLATFAKEIIQGGLLHYSKLIDISTSIPGCTEEELTTLAQALREVRTDTPRGPLAIIVDPNRGNFAKFFSELDVDGRPVRIFRSIHDARGWLIEQTTRNE